MLYFITGEPNKVFKKATELVDLMLKKKPDADVFKITSENWDSFEIGELIGGQSLFAKKYIVQLSHILEDKNIEGTVTDLLKEIAESENVFIWSEPKVDTKTKKKIEKHAEKVQEFTDTKKESKSGWGGGSGVFALADAFGERNTKKLWLLYLEQIKTSAPEEIHGTLWWQLKSMILASKAGSAKEADLKPFVYSKSKKFAGNYSAEELQKLSDEMIEIYHEAHRGGAELGIRLEKFILGIK